MVAVLDMWESKVFVLVEMVYLEQFVGFYRVDLVCATTLMFHDL